MRDDELIEKVTFVSYDDFVRAHHLMASPEKADAALRHILEHFRAKPEDEFVMGPDFLAVLALFSERGRRMAEAMISPADLRQLQRKQAETTPAIARAFPSILQGNHS